MGESFDLFEDDSAMIELSSESSNHSKYNADLLFTSREGTSVALEPLAPTASNLYKPQLRQIFYDIRCVLSSKGIHHGFTKTLQVVNSEAINADAESRFVMDPNSRLRLMVEASLLLACVYDMVITPVRIAWDLTPTITTEVIGVIDLLVWFSSMAATFFTGYYKDGL